MPTQVVTAKFARKLERERDEVRESLEEEKKFHHQTHAELVQTQCKLLDMQIGRDEAREIAARLAHFLERPAYSVDEAIARMEALNSYKKLKSK